MAAAAEPPTSSSPAASPAPCFFLVNGKAAALAMFFVRTGDLRLEPTVFDPFWAYFAQSLLCLGLAKPRLAGAPPGACVLAKSVAASCLVHLRSVHGVEDQQLCPPPCASLVACLCCERLVEVVVRLGPTFPFACTTSWPRLPPFRCCTGTCQDHDDHRHVPLVGYLHAKYDYTMVIRE